MKRINIIGKLILIGLFVTTITPSCTNLDEELYDVVTPEDFLKGDEQYIAYLGAAYTKLYGYAAGGPTEISIATTDEGTYPTRGADWDDGGIHRRRHMHAWTYEDMGGVWGFAFGGIVDCNRLIESYEVLVQEGSVDAEDAKSFIAELAMLRAFFYFTLGDAYGNVPIETEFSTADPAPVNNSQAEVYQFIADEINTYSPDLTENSGGTAYGRMNYWAAKALEAKLKINSEVWTGTGDWDGVIAACDEIINSGLFSLENDFFANFDIENSGSSEFIFAIPYDEIFAGGFNWTMRTLHYGSQNTYELTSQPWNGFCTMTEFYDSFDDADLRKGDMGTTDGPAVRRGTFLTGYQYWSDGKTPIVDSGYEHPDDDDEWLYFDPNLTSISNASRQAGARIGKWEYKVGGTTEMSNDFGVFRYADILLLKAEALWRKSGNGSDAQALALVNQVRSTHGGDAIGLLSTLDGPISFKIEEGSVPGGELLNERGREMAFELSRRQDLLRWGLWEEVEKWSPGSTIAGDVFRTEEYRRLMPIPRDQLENNRNLKQNEGYTSAGGG
jgi:hypothetical protein